MRIARIDDDFRDHVGIAQAGVRPRLAGIGRLVDAVAGIEVAANVGFAGSGVDDVGLEGATASAPMGSAMPGILPSVILVQFSP